MALDLLNDATNLFATGLGQHVVDAYHQGLNQILIDNDLDTLNV